MNAKRNHMGTAGAATAGTATDGGATARPARTLNIPPMILYAVLLAFGLFATVVTVMALGIAAPVPMAAGILLAAVLAALVWWLMSRSILWRPAGGWPLLALAWGAAGAFAFALLMSGAMNAIATATHWEAAESALGGAWPEEVGKTTGVALILLALPRLWNRPWDGLLVGMLVGAGFELIETAQYGAVGALEHPNSDAVGLFTMWAVRSVAGPALHIFFSGIAGFGIGLALLGVNLSVGKRLAYGFGGFLTAFALHFLWNYTWPGALAGIMMLVVWPLSLILLIACWRRAKKMAAAMTPEERGAAPVRDAEEAPPQM